MMPTLSSDQSIGRGEWTAIAIAAAIVIFSLGMIAGATIARAETIDGDRITILDGDTIVLPCDPARGIYPGCGERIRLEGIDAPETGPRARCEAETISGLEARAALAEILRGHPVDITRTGRDRYGRTLARLTTSGRSVDEAMLAAAELESVFGWSGGRMASHYTRSADRKRLGLAASSKLSGPPGGHPIPAPPSEVRD